VPQKRGLCVGKAGKLKGSKISLLVDEKGYPADVKIHPAGRDDRYACQSLIYSIPKGSLIVCDKGYDAEWLRKKMRKCGLKPLIYRRQMGNKIKRRQNNPVTYKGRWRNERGFAWADHFKRLITRFERYVTRYKAFWQLACTVICLRYLPD
jgi:transposase